MKPFQGLFMGIYVEPEQFEKLASRPTIRSGEDDINISDGVIAEMRTLLREKIFACLRGSRGEIQGVFGDEGLEDLFKRLQQSLEPMIQGHRINFTKESAENGILRGSLYVKPHSEVPLMQYGYAVLLAHFERMKRDFEASLREKIGELETEIKNKEDQLQSEMSTLDSLPNDQRVDFQRSAIRAALTRSKEKLTRRLPEARKELQRKQRHLQQIQNFDFQTALSNLFQRRDSDVFQQTLDILSRFSEYMRQFNNQTVPDSNLERIFRELMKCEIELRRQEQPKAQMRNSNGRPERRTSFPLFATAAALALLGGVAFLNSRGNKKPSAGVLDSSQLLDPSPLRYMSFSGAEPSAHRTTPPIMHAVDRMLRHEKLRIRFDVVRRDRRTVIMGTVSPHQLLSEFQLLKDVSVGFLLSTSQGQRFEGGEIYHVNGDPIAAVQYFDPQKYAFAARFGRIMAIVNLRVVNNEGNKPESFYMLDAVDSTESREVLDFMNPYIKRDQ